MVLFKQKLMQRSRYMQLLLISILIVAALAMVECTALELHLILSCQIVVLDTDHLRSRQNLYILLFLISRRWCECPLQRSLIVAMVTKGEIIIGGSWMVIFGNVVLGSVGLDEVDFLGFRQLVMICGILADVVV